MRIRRGLLFAGLFLIPLGAMTLLVRAGSLDPAALTDVWRLWPLILVGFGIALLLGRGRAASLGTAFAALVLGVLAGSTIASGHGFIGSIPDCGRSSGGTERLDRSGTFGGPATVAIDLDCGSVSLSTQAGEGWSVGAQYRGAPPTVNGSTDRLEVRVPDGGGVQVNTWTISTPADELRAIELKANAAAGSLMLDGATLRLVQVDANASDILVDARSATVDRIDVAVNAGRARIALGQGAAVGAISVNAGAIDLCVPVGADLRLTVNDQLTFVTNLADRGLRQDGTVWRRAGAGGALIDLAIDGNVASFTLDPDGGCR
jgi:hypothetical protein